MISITTKSPYALLALAELGRTAGSEPVPIGELARRRDIPVQFLEQLFAVLRRAGVISSQRGVKGGYRFAREPSTVTVLEVVELLDGPLGRDADGVFADAAAAARKVLARNDHRRRHRARAARGAGRRCTTSRRRPRAPGAHGVAPLHRCRTAQVARAGASLGCVW